jgi:hypothetical protein
VNISPKGLRGTLALLDGRRVAYLDLTGSGIETIAHLRENGRIVVMFCSFEGPPRIVRLHGRGRSVLPTDPEFADVSAGFAEVLLGTRSIVVVDVDRISDSCGSGVPLMDFRGDRDLIPAWSKRKGADGLAAYRRQKNTSSIDGLRGLDDEVDTG